MSPVADFASPLDWARDGAGWPLAPHSRFVQAAGLRWHVQHLTAGPGAPVVVLLHGTGASAHSWRDVAPRLQAAGCEVLVPDLPGHAFTGLPPAGSPEAGLLSLPGMARGVAALLQAMARTPTLVAGHSAGAAVAVQMVLDRRLRPQALAGLNAALLPLRRWPAPLFAPAARLLSSSSLVPRLFAWQAADPGVVRRLLDGTGSRLDASGQALYGRLVSRAAHAEGALRMMAAWDLQALQQTLPRLDVPLHLAVGLADATVPPDEAQRVLDLLAQPVRRPVRRWENRGHLAHEERPELAARWLLDVLASV